MSKWASDCSVCDKGNSKKWVAAVLRNPRMMGGELAGMVSHPTKEGKHQVLTSPFSCIFCSVQPFSTPLHPSVLTLAPAPHSPARVLEESECDA